MSDLRQTVEAVPHWYHTLELGDGMVTPGYFDLRTVVARMPWPDVRGKRCLDVGTYDGFLAFELERRGAAEVVALDIPNHEDWDWPPDVRIQGAQQLAKLAGPEKGAGFRVARAALESKVEKIDMNVYELGRERVGRFDVVVCGSLLLHLRDPLGALERICDVCDGVFMSSEEVDLPLSVLHPRRAVARLNGSGPQLQWWVPNVAGHRRMIFAAGFEILRRTSPYPEPFGAGHPARLGGSRRRAGDAFRKVFAGGTGVPHAALLARPRLAS